MMRRHKVVLYNPQAAFFTMPLALVALSSALGCDRYEVRIVDGRLEHDAVPRVIAETQDALCLGITVLTGTPILDALRVSRAVKAARPDCPVIWGGWHPSLFPQDTLVGPSVDVSVLGQGEETFAEIVARLAERASLHGVAGCVFKEKSGGGDASAGDIVVGPPRPARDINQFPAADYGRIPVEHYFARKRERQLDYVSSQGCRFRCTFCADPTVYGRAWFGLEPARVGDELEQLWRRYRFDDLGFQDETFFTHAKRVADIAEQILRRGLVFTWMATMRADQGARLDEPVLAACRCAGLRRVMIGLESGWQATLDWMKKDTKVDQVFEAAEKCRRQGIGVLFNLIVGFPDEPLQSVTATLRIAKQLRALGPDFQVAIFYYRPYPGSEIADLLARRGHRLPRSLEEWAEFDDVASPSPWVDRTKHDLVERFKFYQRIGWARTTPLRAPLQALARWRCGRDLYAFPIEKALIEWLRPSMMRS